MELSIQEQHFDRRSKVVMLAIAFVQGFLLYLLHHTFLKDYWLLKYEEVSLTLNLLIIFIPITIILSYRQAENRLPYWTFIAGLALVLAIVGWQQGSLSGESLGKYRLINSLFEDGVPFIIFIFWFMVCFFLKGGLYEKTAIASYPSLFSFSWHNYLTIKLSFIFTWIFLGILMLWAELFTVVDINFFKNLFREEWFLYPVLTTIFTYGVILFRTQVNAVETIQRILRILLKTLLPILILIAIMFVAVLPFTGVGLIWEKGFGSGVILGFIYITLFFFNAVYQDGSENPYSERVSQVIKYSLIVLLVFCALCFYGFGLRVEQYGWTEERLWLAILTIVSTTFVVLYSLVILFKKNDWSELFGKVNTLMAMVVIVILFLILTPVMDLKKISANSQYNRLISGEVKADEFDFIYMSKLGVYGKNKLTLLKEFEGIKSDPKLLSTLNLALEKKLFKRNGALTPLERSRLITVYPEGQQIEKGVWTSLTRQTNYCTKKECFILKQDLNDDQQEEYLFFKHNYKNLYQITFIEKRGEIYHASRSRNSVKLSADSLSKIKQQKFSLKPSKWQGLYIGDQQIPFNTNTK